MDAHFEAELKRRRESVRNRLAQPSGELKGDVFVLFSSPVSHRNSDVEYAFRQHSDFYYLTGFEEPGCALLLCSDAPGYVLFVRARNREKETWDGRRVGVERAPSLLGADCAHAIDELDEKLADYFENRERVHFLIGERRDWDQTVIGAMNRVRGRRAKKVCVPSTVVDARVILHEMRLFKSSWEQEAMREVCELTAQGHRAAMKASRPGLSEWQLQDVVEGVFREKGSRRTAYESIVGSGENATILHYRENSRTMLEGDLVLIDAGAEKNYLAADITRTFPVGGKFTPAQARIYQYVLNAQLAAILLCRVGATLQDVHEAAARELRAGLLAEGLLATEASEEETSERVKRFFMHRTSHFLGMDVHDVSYGAAARKLGPGMVITVEPGLYFASDDETVPQELRGIGIRIEDDVLITEDQPVVLTADAPKTIEEIEEACRA